MVTDSDDYGIHRRVNLGIQLIVGFDPCWR
jgi:hypothetical protein